MFKRKLFKRALPIILSVAMVFQSAPTTAFAAESTTEPETVIEQSTEEVVDDDADDNKEGGDEADGGQNEGGNEESKSPETQTTEETKTAETQTAEENKDAEETQTEETKAAEAEEGEAADDVEAALSKAVISVDEDTLVNQLAGYTYDYTTKTVEKSFIADSTQTAKDVLTAAKAAVTVTVDNQNNATAAGFVTYKWEQKGADGNFASMPDGELPQAANEYRLVISLGDVDGVCAAADNVAVNLEIKKAEITLDSTVKQFNPGVTVAEVKEKNADFTLKQNNTTLTKEAYISASTIEVKDAAGTALADTDILEKDKDYTLNINVTLKDEFAKNYEVKSEPVNIILNAAVQTTIKVTYKTEGETIGKTYDGKAIDAAAEVASKYDAKVVYTKDGKETELTDAKLTGTWCDADKIAYEDAEFAPVDAGTYYYKISYTDETGTYKDADAYVRVVIDMADIVIDPVIDVKEYSEGTVASAITKTVTYDVYEVKDGVKAEKPMDIDKEYFWGTTYNKDDDFIQYYEPVFVVQKGVKDGDKVTWTTLSNSTQLSGKDIVYRVVFNGKKASHPRLGSEENYSIDINESQQNYTVDVTADAIDKYAEDITVTYPVEIDVAPILEDGKGADYENAMIRTYNGQPKYETRDQYKKATAKVGDKSLDAANLVYTWEMADSNSYAKDENGKWVVGKWINRGSWYDGVEYYSNPINAGEYRLKVEYKDTKSGLYSKEPKYVYYTILPQNVKTVLTGTPKVYKDDLTAGDFINSLQCVDSTAVNNYVKTSVFKVTDEAGTAGDDISGSFSFDKYYENPAAYFSVVRKINEGENAGKYVAVDSGESFSLGEEYELRWKDSTRFTNYNFGVKLDNHGQAVVDADPLYDNTGVKVEVLDSSLIGLNINIDESQITGNVKTYDAKPFDLTALKSLVKVTNEKDGSEVTDAEVKYEFLVNPQFDEEMGYLTGADEWWSTEDAIHGGTYCLHIYVETNDKYRYSDKLLDTEFVINKANLTIVPNLQEEIKAGIKCGDLIDEAISETYTVMGYIGDDADLLEYGSVTAVVYTATSKEAYDYDAYLRSGETYYVQCADGSFITEGEAGNPLYGDRDYELVYERVSFVPVRAEAYVTAYDTALRDEISGTPDEGYTHTVTTQEGIPYYKNYSVTVNGKTEKIDGNLFIFWLNAPDEFKGSDRNFNNNTFVYRNNIEKAGGYVLATYNNSIKVAFKADPEKLTEKKTFDILWDTGYSEKFVIDFSKSILEDDMTKAVAPKSLAFNGANTKMAVGDTQQLDVKITKAQMADIILLGYKSSDESVLKVTDTGFVTALSTKGAKSATATVEVYPCYVNEEGVKTRIANAKAATVKITVSDVVAPKISKVTPYGTWAYLTYQKPANGYKTEVYVLEGKKKEADFEAEIAKVINGDFSAFTFTSLTAHNTPDAKGNINVTINRGLSPKSEYTVYVRNVSGLRTLEDGSTVAASHAGAVKTFKTTKANTIQIFPWFKQTEGQPVATSVGRSYTAKLKDKTAQLSVDARYYEKYSKSYSDANDYIWRTLPLSGTDKDNYEEPKLMYCVVDPDGVSVGNSRPNGYSYRFDDYYYRGSNLVTVDKKGKVTFNGKGEVRIFVVDPSQSGVHDYVDLYIDASADSITGKAVKMSVGETIDLYDYLEYKEGKNKLANYQWWFARLSIDKESDEYFSIEPYMNEDGTAYNYAITALKPGGTLELTVTDKTVEENKGTPAKVKITSSVINPVKSLKASYVVDKFFEVTYSYPLSGYMFRFDLKDASGKTIKSETDWENGTWNAKTKTYDYTRRFEYPEITLLSTYNLTVTALYNGQESKATKLTVKTTNIPASYTWISGNSDGGTDITVTTKNNNSGTLYLRDYPVLKSGNTYTLDVPLDSTNNAQDNKAARYRKTDTLTWKSSNTKVATVKANAGSYTATLKALNKGETTIEVTSKITKKVIARWTVTINAVGEAGGYYGDNEPYRTDLRGDAIDPVVIDEKDMLELTMNNEIYYKLNKGEGQWYVFTAPAYGSYTFYSFNLQMDIYDSKWTTPDKATDKSYTLEKGDKRYIFIDNGTTKGSVSGYVQVTGVMYTELALGENKVAGGSAVVFTAPTTNHYTISYDLNGSVQKYEYDLTAGSKKSLTIGSQGRDYVVTVSCREAGKTVVGGEGAAVSLGSATDEKWFEFTADETGIYTFYTTGATDVITGTIKESLQNNSSVVTSGAALLGTGEGAEMPKDYKSAEITLKKGQTVYIELTAASATKDKAVTATFKVDKAASVEDGKPVSTDSTTAKTITYVTPSQGDYRFTFTATPADAIITATVDGSPVSNNVYEQTSLAKDKLVKITVQTDKAADVSVAVEKTTKKVLSIGDNKVNLAANATETVAFYATNSGYYTFKCTPADIKSDETEYLVAGDKKEFTLRSATAQEVTVTVSKADVAALASGDVTVGTNATKYFKYTATKEGLYSFGITKDENVSVTESDSLAFTTTTNKYIDKGAIYMTAGETFYVKISSTEAAAATAKATVTIDALQVTALTAGTETPIELEAGASGWVEFTAKKTARYEYKKQDATGFEILKASSLGTTNGIFDFSDSKGEVINAGTKKYFKVTNNNAEKKTIKLTISEVVAVVAGQSAELKNGEGKWFEFTADAAARYTFSATAVKEGQTPGASIVTSINTLTNTKDYDREQSSFIFNQGEKRYFYVTASYSGTDTVAVSLEVVKAGQDGELTAADGITFKENETKTLTWTAPETGWFTFSAMVGEEVAEGLTIYYYTNLNESNDRIEAVSVIYCEEGDKLTFEITSSKAQTVKFAMTKETVIPVTSTETEVKMKAGDEKIFSFTEKEAARYFIELTNTEAVGEYWDLTEGHDVYEGSIKDGYVTFVGKVNSEYVFNIAAGEFEGEKSFKIKGGIVAPTALETGTPATIAKDSLTPNHYAWYKFTAPEDGKYAFKLANAQAKYIVAESLAAGFVNENADEYADDFPSPGELVLEKGMDVYFAVYSETALSADAVLSANKVTAATLTEDAAVKIKIADLAANEQRYISFTAPADGRYIFTNTADQTLTAHTYKTLVSESNNGSVTWGAEKGLKKGDELVFAVSAATVPSADFEIKVSHVTTKAITVSEEAQEVALTAEDSRWLVFTADKTGKYTFEFATESGSTYVFLWDNPGDNSWKERVYASITADSCEYIVEKGNSIFFQISDLGAITLKVKASLKEEIAELKLGDNAFDTTNATVEQYAYFTATETGVYKFTVSADKIIYHSDNKNNFYPRYGIIDNEGFILNAGDSIYFIEDIGNKGIIKVEQKGSVDTLKENVAKNVSVNTTDFQWLSFTPAYDGWYRLDLSKDGYVYTYTSDLGRYYQDDGRYESWGDSYRDPGGQLNLEADQTIYFAVKSTNTATTSVRIKTERVEIQDMYVDGGYWDTTMNKGDVQYICFDSSDYNASWQFDVTANKSVSVSYATGSVAGSYKSAGSGTNVAFSSQADEEDVYIKLTATQDDTEVKVSADVEYIWLNSMGDHYGMPYINFGQSRRYIFTARKEARYYFDFFDEQYCNNVTIQIKDTTGKEIVKRDFVDTDASTISALLQAGQTVYIDINASNEDYLCGDVYINSVITTPITLGSPVQVYLNPYEKQELTFTPDADGNYQFIIDYEWYSVDAYLYIDGKPWNGDEYAGYDSGSSVTLKAGQNVQLFTNSCDEYYCASFTVAVREYEEPEYE